MQAHDGTKTQLAVDLCIIGGGSGGLSVAAAAWLRAARGLLHAASGWTAGEDGAVRQVVIEHEKALGPLVETTRWRREAAERWVELGRRDARRARGAVEAALGGEYQ